MFCFASWSVGNPRAEMFTYWLIGFFSKLKSVCVLINEACVIHMLRSIVTFSFSLFQQTRREKREKKLIPLSTLHNIAPPVELPVVTVLCNVNILCCKLTKSWRYVGYPESKFRWAAKKKSQYITNHLYCHFMYIPYTTFRHSFQHCWGACHSIAPIFVSHHHRILLPAVQSTW
jgi:hypothetical protein